jgi:hypothetical protein
MVHIINWLEKKNCVYSLPVNAKARELNAFIGTLRMRFEDARLLAVALVSDSFIDEDFYLVN